MNRLTSTEAIGTDVEYTWSVDDRGRALDIVAMEEAHALGLRHPDTHVWAADREGNVYMQVRAAHKRWGSKLDPFATGHVNIDDAAAHNGRLTEAAFEQAAVRETEEETGLRIRGRALHRLGNTATTTLIRDPRYHKNQHRVYSVDYMIELPAGTNVRDFDTSSDVAEIVKLNIDEVSSMVERRDELLVPNDRARLRLGVAAVRSLVAGRI